MSLKENLFDNHKKQILIIAYW